MQTDQRPGQAWVSRYLLPKIALVEAQQRQILRCLHFGPGGEEEIQALRDSGRLCESASWNGEILDVRGPGFDLVFGGHFGAMAGPGGPRRRLAAEISRVTARCGAVLLTAANSISCIDLSANSRLVHLPGAAGTLRAEELRQLFVESGFFTNLERLSLAGHFGWGRIPRVLRRLERWLEQYIEWASDPRHPARYASMLNPVMNFWISR
jgi:hypothetical protein